MSVCTEYALKTMFANGLPGNKTPGMICARMFRVIFEEASQKLLKVRSLIMLTPWPVIAKINPLGRT